MTTYHSLSASLFSRTSVAMYGVVICASMIVSHSLTYLIIARGSGHEANPMALLTLWIPPALNVALWGGGMAVMMSLMWERFERNRDVVLATIFPLLFITVADAANDLIVAVQVGIL